MRRKESKKDLEEGGLRSPPQTIEVRIFPLRWMKANALSSLALGTACLFVLPF